MVVFLMVENFKRIIFTVLSIVVILLIGALTFRYVSKNSCGRFFGNTCYTSEKPTVNKDADKGKKKTAHTDHKKVNDKTSDKKNENKNKTSIKTSNKQTQVKNKNNNKQKEQPQNPSSNKPKK